jgi:hypothetical protein
MMLKVSGGEGSGFDDAAVYRAHSDALGLVKVTLAVGALLDVNDVGAVFLADGDVRAFRLAGGTGGAGGRDDFEWHGGSPLWWVIDVDV